MDLEQLRQDMQKILAEWKNHSSIQAGNVFLIGCSTSEIAGEHIGSAGSGEIAEMLFEELKAFQHETGVVLAFQCCEHLNRSVVVERSVALARGWTIVSAIPHAKAGGSMAAHAFRSLDHAVLVEFVEADYGMDIGDTLIGMHLKHVAVPLRLGIKSLGQAHVTYAYTRPKLIGGERALYEK
ncbi:TIGR01440 family protein [Halalkalibacillus sediminis]